MTETKTLGVRLVKDGVWQVPAEERPAGWESMGVKEPIAACTEVVVRLPDAPLVATHVTAERIEDLPRIQPTLIEWCKEKLLRTKAEAQELWDAFQQARERKWKIGTLKKHWELASHRVVYYEKTLDALEAGYCLFPAVECDVFAIRTERDSPQWKAEWMQWTRHPSWEEKAEALPPGSGEYQNPLTPWVSHKENRKDEKGNLKEGIQFSAADYFDKIAFPFSMSKAHVMDAVGKAMALKIFDEIGVIGDYATQQAVRNRRADPVIIGRILDPKRQGYGNGHEKALTFLISWHIDTKDL